MTELTDAQVDLLVACIDSETLSHWLSILSCKPDSVRKRMLHDIIERMRSDGVDEEIEIAVTRLLHPNVFAAFLRTVNLHKNAKSR